MRLPTVRHAFDIVLNSADAPDREMTETEYFTACSAEIRRQNRRSPWLWLASAVRGVAAWPSYRRLGLSCRGLIWPASVAAR